jgi:uncharacterized protein YbcI
MGQRDRTSLGEMRATISNEIVRLQAEYYGQGPTRAKTSIVDDLVVVVLEDSFTRAEKTLAERGEREAIEHIRRRFQQQMADEFTSVVEQATGRKVGVFLSETNIEHDVSVETFLLADGRTDMTAFEDARADLEVLRFTPPGSTPVPPVPGRTRRARALRRLFWRVSCACSASLARCAVALGLDAQGECAPGAARPDVVRRT